MVLTTSGMWTDENRLLQKLHQEAGGDLKHACRSSQGPNVTIHHPNCQYSKITPIAQLLTPKNAISWARQTRVCSKETGRIATVAATIPDIRIVVQRRRSRGVP